MVIPESSKQSNDSRFVEITECAETNEKETNHYKSQLDALRGNVMILLEKQAKYEKVMSSKYEKLVSKIRRLYVKHLAWCGASYIIEGMKVFWTCSWCEEAAMQENINM